MSNNVKIHEITISESGREEDYVLSSVTQLTRRISFKNIFSKISFSSLKTAGQNILGAINENKENIDKAQADISELNSKLITTKKYSLTYASGLVKTHEVVRKTGNQVYISVVLNGTITSSTDFLLATLPDELKSASKQTSGVICTSRSSAGGQAFCVVSGNRLSMYQYGANAAAWVNLKLIYYVD